MNILSCGVLILSIMCLTLFANELNYPAARRVQQTDNYHGIEVADPYRWMEDLNSQEVKEWIRDQDILLKEFLSKSNERVKIQKRLRELMEYESYASPTGLITPNVVKRNSRYFFIKTKSGDHVPALCFGEGFSSESRKCVHIPARYGSEMNMSGYEPSPDGKLVVLILAKRNSRWLTLKVLNVDTGEELSDNIQNTHILGSSIAWRADGKGFFYNRFDQEEQMKGQPPVPIHPKIYFHTLGTSQSEDTLIYGEAKKPGTLLSFQVTSDGNYLIIHSFDGSNPANRVLYMEIARKNVEPLFDKEDASYTFLGNRGTQWWFYTNLNAQRGRVVMLDLKDQSTLKEIISQMADSISAGSAVGGNAVGIFGNKIALLYTRDSNPALRIFSLDGKLEKEISFPAGGTIWGGFSGSQEDPEVFFQFLSLTSPATFYVLNTETKQMNVLLKPDLKINQNDYETKQVFYQSKDGTRVPMFIAHRKGLKLDANNRAYIYGYGAMGWVAFLWYQPHIVTWIDRGGVYAVPGIRGGGEYGEAWHQAGVKDKKINSIEDFIAASEYLIRNGYTKAGKLVANGSSAGSSVAAAAVIRRPELYGAAVLDIPILDLIRYHRFTNGRYWTPEFGTSEIDTEFKALMSYSPYHNLKKGSCYPPTLVMVGEKDQTALPFHGYKFTANLQYSQKCDHPVLVKTMWDTGHNFGSRLEQRLDSWTDQLMFLERVLK